ncbi:hypothetical protein ACI2OX_11675 [Bacillus sp. N9]
MLLGLKLQKKQERFLKSYFANNLHGEDVKFSLLFNQAEGLWDVNFTLNYIEGFEENISMVDAYCMIYRFLFALLEFLEEER